MGKAQIENEVYGLYDSYCHGQINRRQSLERAAALTIGGVAMAQAMLPNYANGQEVTFTDERIAAKYVEDPYTPAYLFTGVHLLLTR